MTAEDFAKELGATVEPVEPSVDESDPVKFAESLGATVEGTGQGRFESGLSEAGKSFGKVFTNTATGLLRAVDSPLLGGGARAVRFGMEGGSRLVGQPLPDPISQRLDEVRPGLSAVVQRPSESAAGVFEPIINRTTDALLPTNPIYEGEWGASKIPSVVGQATGQLATSLLPAKWAGAGSNAMRAIGLSQAGLMTLSGAAEEADRLGIKDPVKRDVFSTLMAGIESGSEAMGGLGGKSFSKALSGEIRDILEGNALKSFLKTAGAEGIEEVVAKVPQDIASTVMRENEAPLDTINPTKLDYWANLGEAFGLGTIGGAVFGGAQAVMNRKTPSAAMAMRAAVQDHLNDFNGKTPTEAEAAELQELRDYDDRLSVWLAEKGITPAQQKAGLATATAIASNTRAGLPAAVNALREAARISAQRQGGAFASREPAPVAEEAVPTEVPTPEQETRAAQPLIHSGEDEDTVYQDGQWVNAMGQPSPKSAELEALRQQYIATGQLGEGLQPYAPAQESAETVAQPETTIQELTPTAPETVVEEQPITESETVDGIMPTEESTSTKGNRVTGKDGRRGEIVGEGYGKLMIDWADGTKSVVAESELASRSTATTKTTKNKVEIKPVGRGFTVFYFDENGVGHNVFQVAGRESTGGAEAAFKEAAEVAAKKAQEKGLAGYFDEADKLVKTPPTPTTKEAPLSPTPQESIQQVLPEVAAEENLGPAKAIPEPPPIPRPPPLTIDQIVSKLEASSRVPGLKPSALAAEVQQLAGSQIKELAEALGYKASPKDIAVQMLMEAQNARRQGRAGDVVTIEEREAKPIPDEVSSEGIGERAMTLEERIEKRGKGGEEAPVGMRPQDLEGRVQSSMAKTDVPERPRADVAFNLWQEMDAMDARLQAEALDDAWRSFYTAGKSFDKSDAQIAQEWAQELSDPESPVVFQGVVEAKRARKRTDYTPQDVERPASDLRDAEYMAAVRSGDMETAQRMVDNLARSDSSPNERFPEGSGIGTSAQARGVQSPSRRTGDLSKEQTAPFGGSLHEGGGTGRGVVTGDFGSTIPEGGLGTGDAGAYSDAQRLVDDAARRAGYTVGPLWHRTWSNFSEFVLGGKEAKTHSWFSNEGKRRTRVGPSGRAIFLSFNKEQTPAFHNQKKTGENFVRGYAKVKNPLVVDDDTREFAVDVFADGFKDFPLIVTEEARKSLQDAGHDAVYMYYNGRTTADGNPDEVILLEPSQIKSADPVTYDAQGNVIPLSQRFNTGTPDIRFSKPRATIVKGITPANVESAIKGLRALLPNIRNAWTGTRAQLADHLKQDTAFRDEWKRQWLAVNPGSTNAQAETQLNDWIASSLNGQEGFTFNGRTYLISDQVAVYEGESPAQAARRVLVHEDAHEGLNHMRRHDPDIEKRWKELRAEIPAEELDDLAKTLYPWLKDWRNSERTWDSISDEWLAAKIAQIETRGQPEPSSLIGRFVKWLKDVWKKLFASDIDPTDQALLDFMDATRSSRFRDMAQANARGVRYSASDPTGGDDMTPERFFENQNPESRRDYDLWGKERVDKLREFHEQGPEDARIFTEFLGEPTDESRLRQQWRPMIDFAKSKIGGVHGQLPELTQENTENAMGLARAMLTAKEFTDNLRDEFQRANPMHGGDAIGSIMQLELIDYGMRMLAKNGDARLVNALMPVVNDTIVGAYLNMSAAARTLGSRALVNKDNGYFTAIRLANGAQQDMAEKAAGGEKNLEEIVGATRGETVAREFVEGLESDASEAQAEIEKNAEQFEEESWRDAALEVLDAEEKALVLQYETYLREIGEMALVLREMESKAGNMAQPSMAEVRAKYPDVETLKKAMAEKIALWKEVAQKLVQKDTSSEGKDVRRKRSRATPEAKAARAVLTADAQAKKMLERYEERNKRVKREMPEWRKVYQRHIRVPIPNFEERMKSIGITEDAAKKLNETASKIRTERDNAAKEASSKKTSIPDSTAGRLIYEVSKLHRQSGEILVSDPQSDSIRKVFREHVKEPLSAEVFTDRLRTLGVSDEVIERLAIVAERERSDLEKVDATRDALAEVESLTERAESKIAHLAKEFSEITTSSKQKDIDALSALIKNYQGNIGPPISDERFLNEAKKLGIPESTYTRLLSVLSEGRRRSRLVANTKFEQKEAERIKHENERHEREAQSKIDTLAKEFSDALSQKQKSQASTLKQLLDSFLPKMGPAISKERLLSELAKLNITESTSQNLVSLLEETKKRNEAVAYAKKDSS